MGCDPIALPSVYSRARALRRSAQDDPNIFFTKADVLGVEEVGDGRPLSQKLRVRYDRHICSQAIKEGRETLCRPYRNRGLRDENTTLAERGGEPAQCVLDD